MEDRRKFPRVHVSKEIRISGPKGAAFGVLRDMSLGGAALILQFPIAQVGDTVEIELPHEREGLIPLSGQVVRLVDTPKGKEYGIKFYRGANAAMHENRKRLLKEGDSASSGRRKHPRIASRVMVRYGTPAELRAILENISMGGFAIMVDHPVDLNKEVPIEIPHPKTRKLLALTGRSVHQQEVMVKGKKCYRVGFEFKFLRAEQRAELSEFLEELLEMSEIISQGQP